MKTILCVAALLLVGPLVFALVSGAVALGLLMVPVAVGLALIVGVVATVGALLASGVAVVLALGVAAFSWAFLPGTFADGIEWHDVANGSNGKSYSLNIWRGNSKRRAVSGSGKRASDERSLAPFHSIMVSGSMDVQYRQVADGEAAKCTVTADDNLLALVETRVDDGELIVDGNDSYSTRIGIDLHCQSPSLRSVTLRGSGDIALSDLDTDGLELWLQGGGDLLARGRAASLDASLQGAGDIEAQDLRAGDCNLRLQGSGDISAHCTGKLRASLQGYGDIDVAGDPDVVSSLTLGYGDIEIN